MSNLLFASELGKRPQVARLTEPHTAGSGIFTCEALSGWARECSFVVYEVDPSGNPISGSETDWIGTKNNRNLENLELTAGVDRDYPVDRTYLIATETAGGRNKLIQGLKNTLNDDGTLKAGVVDFSKIPVNSIDASKIQVGTIDLSAIKNGSITPARISSSSTTNNGWNEIQINDKISIFTIANQETIQRDFQSGWGYIVIEDYRLPQNVKFLGGVISATASDAAVGVDIAVNATGVHGTWRNNYATWVKNCRIYWSGIIIAERK